MAEVSVVNLPLDECHSTLLMISQHWVRWWLGAVRQQAITWANVDRDLCRHIAWLGPSELKEASNILYIEQVRNWPHNYVWCRNNVKRSVLFSYWKTNSNADYIDFECFQTLILVKYFGKVSYWNSRSVNDGKFLSSIRFISTSHP